MLSLTQHFTACQPAFGAKPAEHSPLVAQVFARVSPDQKELILRTLRAAGWTTLMCGDGTNDVGALKAAHVGVALLPPSEAQLKAQKAREEHFRQRQKDIATRKAALRSGRPMPPSDASTAAPAQLVAPSASAKGLVTPTGSDILALLTHFVSGTTHGSQLCYNLCTPAFLLQPMHSFGHELAVHCNCLFICWFIETC